MVITFFQRQKVVHDGEDRFLDLTAIARVADQAQLLLEVDHDDGLRARTVDLWEGLEGWCGDHGEVRDMPPVGLLVFGQDEHVAGKQAVPGVLGHDAHRQAVVRVGAGVAVLHEQVAALQEALHAGVQLGELPRRCTGGCTAPTRCSPRWSARAR